MALGQQPEPEVLDQIGVLILIHQDVAEHTMVIRQYIRLAAQYFCHVQQQVAEIGRVQRAQPGLIGFVQRDGPAVGEIRVVVGSDPRGRQSFVFPALDQSHQRGRHPAFRVNPLGFHHLFQQTHLVVGVEDGEVG